MPGWQITLIALGAAVVAATAAVLLDRARAARRAASAGPGPDQGQGQGQARHPPIPCTSATPRTRPHPITSWVCVRSGQTSQTSQPGGCMRFWHIDR
jgi:hypothetical protein